MLQRLVLYLAYKAVPLLVETAFVTLGPYTCTHPHTYISEHEPSGTQCQAQDPTSSLKWYGIKHAELLSRRAVPVLKASLYSLHSALHTVQCRFLCKAVHTAKHTQGSELWIHCSCSKAANEARQGNTHNAARRSNQLESSLSSRVSVATTTPLCLALVKLNIDEGLTATADILLTRNPRMAWNCSVYVTACGRHPC